MSATDLVLLGVMGSVQMESPMSIFLCGPEHVYGLVEGLQQGAAISLLDGENKKEEKPYCRNIYECRSDTCLTLEIASCDPRDHTRDSPKTISGPSRHMGKTIM